MDDTPQKKQWSKPVLRRLVAGSAEAKSQNRPDGTSTLES